MSSSPMITPVISTNSSVTPYSIGPGQIVRSMSATSLHALTHLPSASASTHTLSGAEPIQEEGLRHVNIVLEARQYKTPAFAAQLLDCLRLLKVPFWSTTSDLQPSRVKIQKVSGSLTNAVFFVSYPFVRHSRTILLRVYGSSSGSLISRPRELHTLHILSSQYHIGPRVYGTFVNGRIEEYFESTTLTPSDIRDPVISQWIGARMAELHSVDIEAVHNISGQARGKDGEWKIGARENVRQWLGPAEDVLSLSNVGDEIRSKFNLSSFKREWSAYLNWLNTVDNIHNGSRRVFAHNDTQYGNLLRLTQLKDFVDEHRQLIVVDFEYASPNPASFDIANHFHEWTANYHSSTPHLLDRSRYPTKAERYNLYTAYLTHSSPQGEHLPLDGTEQKLQLMNLDKQVRYWSPASHAMWAIWGIVQAREDLERGPNQLEFDYLKYALCRLTAFRQEVRELGVNGF